MKEEMAVKIFLTKNLDIRSLCKLTLSVTLLSLPLCTMAHVSKTEKKYMISNPLQCTV